MPPVAGAMVCKDVTYSPRPDNVTSTVPRATGGVEEAKIENEGKLRAQGLTCRYGTDSTYREIEPD